MSISRLAELLLRGGYRGRQLWSNMTGQRSEEAAGYDDDGSWKWKSADDEDSQCTCCLADASGRTKEGKDDVHREDRDKIKQTPVTCNACC